MSEIMRHVGHFPFSFTATMDPLLEVHTATAQLVHCIVKVSRLQTRTHVHVHIYVHNVHEHVQSYP